MGYFFIHPMSNVGCDLDPSPISNMAIGFDDVRVGFGLGFWRRQLRRFLRHRFVHTLSMKQDKQKIII